MIFSFGIILTNTYFLCKVRYIEMRNVIPIIAAYLKIICI